MASPVATTETNLDSILNELLRSADDWAGLKELRMHGDDAHREQGSSTGVSPSSSSSHAANSVTDPEHPCFDQLSRAISTHITDLLMRKLKAKEQQQQQDNEETDDEERPWIDEQGRERRGRNFVNQHNLGGESARSSRESLLSVGSTSSRLPRPIHRPKVTARSVPKANGTSARGSELGSTSNLSMTGSRFHSENRLDRQHPPARVDETPLENRASRLRRMSIECKQRERTRSVASSPMVNRRHMGSRCGSGYLNQN